MKNKPKYNNKESQTSFETEVQNLSLHHYAIHVKKSAILPNTHKVNLQLQQQERKPLLYYLVFINGKGPIAIQ